MKDKNDGQWFSAYGRKHKAEKYLRKLSTISVRQENGLGVSDRRRMAFIGTKKVNCPVSEPNENSSDSHYHLPFSGNI